MRKNIIRGILILLLLWTFFIIFGFSSQDSEKSGGVSAKVTKVVTDRIQSIQEKSKQEQEKAIGKVETVIRKIAHFSIYAVVGLLLMSLLYTYNIKTIDRAAISQVISIIYALTDEIHQAFVPRKSGNDYRCYD